MNAAPGGEFRTQVAVTNSRARLAAMQAAPPRPLPRMFQARYTLDAQGNQNATAAIRNRAERADDRKTVSPLIDRIQLPILTDIAPIYSRF